MRNSIRTQLVMLIQEPVTLDSHFNCGYKWESFNTLSKKR